MIDAVKEMLVRLAARDAWTRDMYGFGVNLHVDPGYEIKPYNLHKLYAERMVNWPIQSFASELAINFGDDELVYFPITRSPEQEAASKAHWAKMDEWQTNMDRKLFETTGQVWNRELLAGNDKPSSAAEMQMRFTETSEMLSTFIASWEKDMRAASSEMDWTVDGYLIVYIQRRPRVIHYGWGGPSNSYKEELSPKRFRSTRQARLWARQSIGSCIMHMMMQPFKSTFGPLDLTFKLDSAEPLNMAFDWGHIPWTLKGLGVDTEIKP